MTVPDEQKFWFQWEVVITLDSEIETLHSASLRIVDKGFHEKMPQKTRDEISKVFVNNMLIC